jgi:hypothetical protein
MTTYILLTPTNIDVRWGGPRARPLIPNLATTYNIELRWRVQRSARLTIK